jgi:murein L,D-transpeptidase YafK
MSLLHCARHGSTFRLARALTKVKSEARPKATTVPSRGPRRLCRPILAALALASFLAASGAAMAETPGKADRIIVLKAKRELQLLRDGVVLKSYPIALGPHPKGPKRRRGDGRTPEGTYVVDYRFTRTPYHRALHISYPDTSDRALARKANVSPGGDIVIHGMPARFGHNDPVRFFRDWTKGCIAVGNIAIEEIWASVDDGTPIEIRP